MNQHDIDRKIGFFEKAGEVIGKIVGTVIKAPFRFIPFAGMFLVAAGIAFLYSFGKGWKKEHDEFHKK